MFAYVRFMAHTLHQLVDLLIGSIPTVIIFLLLHAVLKRVLYRPLHGVLAARRARMEGRAEAAEALLAQVDAKLTAYEAAILAARAEGYRRLEERRRTALAERDGQIGAAKQKTAAAVAEARAQLANDVDNARVGIHIEAGRLAEGIAALVLGERPRKAIEPVVPV